MVLDTDAFRFHRSLRKTVSHLLADGRLDIRFDHDFERVIKACAHAPRAGQSGTWIVPAMMDAYIRLHGAGHAHSVEAWIDNELAGGLYCINLGAMVYGESMFSLRKDASKMALAALVAFCRAMHIPLIDCQQETPHLASMGATPIPRAAFSHHLEVTTSYPTPRWQFAPVYWSHLFSDSTGT
jgi:leucyl/phenylalanyl-tRNA---protein transferase